MKRFLFRPRLPGGCAARSMSIQAKVLKYPNRGSSIQVQEEFQTLASPGSSQALIRFLASPVSMTDFRAIQSR